MSSNSNMGYHYGAIGAIPASVFNPHVVTFQSGSMSSSSGVLLPVNYSGGINSTAGMIPTGNPGEMNNIAGLVQTGNSISGLLLDTVPGLKQETCMTMDWSIEEQSILEECLREYTEEQGILKYIKIAALLRDKTVRDVALRCRWMTKKDNGKRRKQEEYYIGKKMKDRKEKLMDSSLKANTPVPQPNMAACSYMMHHVNLNDQLSCEVPSFGGVTRQLLDVNAQVFSQITNNLAILKTQENIDLFCCARTNIIAILNDMRNTPGIMNVMPPLPVMLNEDLANTLLPSSSQAPIFAAPGGIHLKLEPKYW